MPGHIKIDKTDDKTDQTNASTYTDKQAAVIFHLSIKLKVNTN